MNKVVIMILLSLSACSQSVPVKEPFPEVPAILLENPPMLKPLTMNNVELSDILDNANTNYGEFYKLREKLVGWQYWYSKQKEIFNQLNEKKE